MCGIWIHSFIHSFIHERDSIVQCSRQSLFLGDVLEFCIQKVFHCLAKTSLYFASPAIRCMSSFVDKNNRRNPLPSLLFVLSPFLKRQPLHHESRHVSEMTTAASCKMCLDAIMIGCRQGNDTFAAFQPMENFYFWRNGDFTFFQRCLQPLYLSWSTPISSQVFPLALASSSLMILSACSTIELRGQ